jgi:hypothetical protein
MWILLPAKPTVPLPHVPTRLARELKKIDRWVRKAHRELEHGLADKIEETFDAMKMLAGQMSSDSPEKNRLLETWNDAKTTFLYLVKELLTNSAAGNDLDHVQALNGLSSLRQRVHQVGQDALQSEISQKSMGPGVESPQWKAWRSRMQPLMEQLKNRVGHQVLATIEKIEQKLAFLLTHEDENEVFDISRFEVKQIADKYLPEAIDEYLKLPSDLARNQRLRNNYTAEEVLNEQLIRLDHTLEEMTVSLFEQDAQGLLVHGRFLKNKFSDKGFKINLS